VHQFERTLAAQQLHGGVLQHRHVQPGAGAMRLPERHRRRVLRVGHQDAGQKRRGRLPEPVQRQGPVRFGLLQMRSRLLRRRLLHVPRPPRQTPADRRRVGRTQAPATDLRVPTAAQVQRQRGPTTNRSTRRADVLRTPPLVAPPRGGPARGGPVLAAHPHAVRVSGRRGRRRRVAGVNDFFHEAIEYVDSTWEWSKSVGWRNTIMVFPGIGARASGSRASRVR
jgi:hypothetical protein